MCLKTNINKGALKTYLVLMLLLISIDIKRFNFFLLTKLNYVKKLTNTTKRSKIIKSNTFLLNKQKLWPSARLRQMAPPFNPPAWVSGATKWPGLRMEGDWCFPSCCWASSLKHVSPLDSPLSLPLAYWRGLPLSMLLKLWLRRLRLDDPGLLEAPLPAAGTLEGPGNLEEPDKHSVDVFRHWVSFTISLWQGWKCIFWRDEHKNLCCYRWQLRQFRSVEAAAIHPQMEKLGEKFCCAVCSSSNL